MRPGLSGLVPTRRTKNVEEYLDEVGLAPGRLKRGCVAARSVHCAGPVADVGSGGGELITGEGAGIEPATLSQCCAAQINPARDT